MYSNAEHVENCLKKKNTDYVLTDSTNVMDQVCIVL